MPYWLDWVGGYTALGTRVLVLALAAMSLNFLLGFTGVLSFGHAAYFGLGVYGAGLTIKYLVPNTLAGMAVGVGVGTRRRRADRRADRAPARHLFRHGDDRLWPGVLFHRLSLELGHRRRRRAQRLAAAADRSRLRHSSIFSTATTPSIISSCSVSRSPWRSWRRCCARRSGAPCWRSARTSGARAFSASRSTATSGCRG